MPKNITSVEWQAQDIPPGLAFDKATGTFTGTPAGVGDYTVPVTVTTNYGTDTKDVLIKAPEGEEIIDASNSRYITECVDNGSEIIFFGNYNNGKRGIFFTYNPVTETKSATFDISDGKPLTVNDVSDTSENYAFKESAIDPVSKKWLAFFGTHYVRTPDGVKDLGSDVDLGIIGVCWSNNLQKFCVISDNRTYNFGEAHHDYTSYLFDIDGNLLASSKQLNEIDNFNLHRKALAWSDTTNKFVAVSSSMISSSRPYRITIYSPDGLSWSSSVISDSQYNSQRKAYDTESLITINDGSFILTSTLIYLDSLTWSVGCGTGILKSSDGITWTRYNKQMNYEAWTTAWSSSKGKLYAVTNKNILHETTNFSDWTQVKEISDIPIADDVYSLDANPSPIKMIWSETANALVIPALKNDFYIVNV